MMTHLVMGLAAHYITYVVTQSSFPPIERARDAIVNKRGPGSWQAYLSTCIWCVSFYAAAAVTAVTAQFADVPVPAVFALAVASGSGSLLTFTEWLDAKHTLALHEVMRQIADDEQGIEDADGSE